MLCIVTMWTYRVLSKVAEGDFPIAPNPTPIASPSKVDKSRINADKKHIIFSLYC